MLAAKEKFKPTATVFNSFKKGLVASKRVTKKTANQDDNKNQQEPAHGTPVLLSLGFFLRLRDFHNPPLWRNSSTVRWALAESVIATS